MSLSIYMTFTNTGCRYIYVPTSVVSWYILDYVTSIRIFWYTL